jgi:hypothetical protein
MSEPFASYEKTVESTVTLVKHKVRILLNETLGDILPILAKIPTGATVSMVLGDDETNDEWPQHGEITFIEERKGKIGG